jgi:hypothetical protein
VFPDDIFRNDDAGARGLSSNVPNVAKWGNMPRIPRRIYMAKLWLRDVARGRYGAFHWEKRRRKTRDKYPH